jgi:hypothetical protein
MRLRRPDLYKNDPKPCPRCLVWFTGMVDQRYGLAEMVQPLPSCAPALARDGSGPCCADCQSADTLHQQMNKEPAPQGLHGLAAAAQSFFRPIPYTEACEEENEGPHRSTSMTWRMGRVAVGNDRREQLRLPGFPTGLCVGGLMALSAKGDLERHGAWLKQNGLGPVEEGEE